MSSWKLTLMVSEAATVQAYDLVCRGQVLIGRTPPADVQIGGATVSRQHCWLRISDTGAVTVEDAQSSGGTYLNETRVVGVQPFGGDDELQIGRYTVRLVGDPQPL